VLTGITQESEWAAAADPKRNPRLRRHERKGPAFNVAHLEDRTSVVFWRLIRMFFARDPGR